MNNTEQDMCDEWEKFCKDNSLPFKSADDVLCMCWDTMTEEQRNYVHNFIERWDEARHRGRI